MKHAVENNITLPINYCNSFYKSQFQVKGNRERIASLVKGENEDLTEAGYIRRIEFRRDGDVAAESTVRASELQKFDLSGHHLVVSYFEPNLKSTLASPETGRKPSAPVQEKISISRTLSGRLELREPALVNGFHQLFVEKKGETEVRRDLLQNCQVNTRDDLKQMIESIGSIMSLKKFEHTGSGFPEIY
jgi:hypothetical protein